MLHTWCLASLGLNSSPYYSFGNLVDNRQWKRLFIPIFIAENCGVRVLFRIFSFSTSNWRIFYTLTGSPCSKLEAYSTIKPKLQERKALSESFKAHVISSNQARNHMNNMASEQLGLHSTLSVCNDEIVKRWDLVHIFPFSLCKWVWNLHQKYRTEKLWSVFLSISILESSHLNCYYNWNQLTNLSERAEEKNDKNVSEITWIWKSEKLWTKNCWYGKSKYYCINWAWSAWASHRFHWIL